MQIPTTEKLKSIPEFVGIRVNEEPCYQVVETLRGIEIRGYDPIRVAKTTVAGDFDAFREPAFKRLASFIFGDNAEERQISMTSPVFLEPGEAGWTMAFALPAKFLTAPVPRPTDGTVSLELIPSRVVAVRTFSGTNTEAKMHAAARELEFWLEKHPVYRAASPVWWAQYDAPFVLPFVKTNEAMVQVHRQQ